MLTPSCVVLNDFNCKLGYLWGCWEQVGVQWSDKKRQDEPPDAPKQEERRVGRVNDNGVGPTQPQKIRSYKAPFFQDTKLRSTFLWKLENPKTRSFSGLPLLRSFNFETSHTLKLCTMAFAAWWPRRGRRIFILTVNVYHLVSVMNCFL